MSNLEIQTKQQLDKYITQRGQRESFIFQLSQDNVKLLSKNLLQEIKQPIAKYSNAEFNRIYSTWDDGTIRNFPQHRPIEEFDTVSFPSSFMGKNIKIGDKYKQVLLTAYKLVNGYGHAWNNRFVCTYFITSNNSIVGYGEGMPWALQAKPDLNLNQEEYYYSADAKHNPERKSVLTSLYYDVTANDWRVSTLNPAYDNDNNLIGVAGQDIVLSDLMKNTINDRLPGTYNLIFHKNGRLIAHPKYMKEIMEAQGKLSIQELNNQALSHTFEIIKQQDSNSGVLENIKDKTYLGFSRLKSTDWYFVTVYPKSLLSSFAIGTIKFILIAALISLIIEIVLLFSVLHKEIAKPLNELITVADDISAGQLDINLELKREDEIGRLATSLNIMATQLNTTFSNLENAKAELENKVEERTQELQKTLVNLRNTQAQMLQAEKMSALGQTVAGVAHEINNPVNFIHANIEYIDTYVKDLLELVAFYQEYYPETPELLQEKIDKIDLEFIKEDSVKILASMNIGSIRIREIVKSLRSFSRLDEADYKQVDIHQGIDNTLLILKHRLKHNSTQSEIQIIKDYALIPLVECYAGKLNQVFMNILGNAIDALSELRTSDTIATISISTQVIDKNWVKICIADNGTGINEEVSKNIFNPFFTTKPVGKGTGLGLSISYQIIVETHKGKIYCDSELGKGTKFVIEIPIRQ
ncbi:integral membrane sensor signal transduction histidine kinase [Calothrix parasitica NIES-267]|uniref:histidine kinase n=1 Tax=Calothrix parasitica NIES-267 TaxID=1973488 RepID=A0A1Z4LZ47_9CYAN|nr:integral membrane sensor signal transduction histidine kinase [Calothrix parasitica NIES-267]